MATSRSKVLSVVVTGDTQRMSVAFRKGSKDADRELGALQRRVKGHALGISKSMLGAAAGFTSVAGAITELKSSVKTVEGLAKGTAMLSRTTGIDNKTSSEWVSVAKTRGVAGDAQARGCQRDHRPHGGWVREAS
jgi:hypothetical protein